MLGWDKGAWVRKFSIAGLQLDVGRGDNICRIDQEVRAAKRRLSWIDMVVIGELSAYGPSTDNAEDPAGRAETEFRRIARENGVWLIPGSIFERSGSQIRNMCPVIAPDGEVVARYRKLFPFYPYEQGVSPGNSFCVFEVPGVGKLGLSICYDIWFPEVTRTLVFEGAEIVINPSLTNTIDRDAELAIVRASAAMNQCFVFNVNGAGDLGLGRSIVCGPGGEVMYQAGAGREIFALELDLDYLTQVRERGWHGLGQVLKSWRDSTLRYPPYEKGARSPAFETLGALEKPRSDEASSSDDGGRGHAHLKIAKP